MSHLSGSPRLRRALGLTAASALTLSSLAALTSAPAYAAEPDPAPAAAGAAWLEGQLTDGVLHNDQFESNDYGLTIDTGLALVELGGHDDTVDAISDAVAQHVAEPGDEFPYLGDGTTESYAGPLAKTAVFARSAGDDPTAFGGTNLVESLEQRVNTDGATAGRIQDQSEFGDFANAIGQAFAVRALDEANSALTDSATDYLIAQQCDEGFFRQTFAALDAAGQDCDDDPNAAPSTDVTALAILGLLSQNDDTDVQTVIADAVSWLVDAQAANGSFGSGSDIPVPNTNSTGLAGWALGAAGETAAAQKAAVFVRALQVDEPAECPSALVGDQGAIAYDVSALAAGRADGITVQQQDQWRRATTQALPALQWAPATGTGPTTTIDTSGFHQAGTKVTLGADGLAPGDSVCFRRTGQAGVLALVGFNGQALVRVTLPEGSAKRTYLSSTGESEGQPLTFHVLDAKTLPVELKSRVAKGGTQVVKIRGLADGERFKAVYRGKRVDVGTANGEGRGVARFAVGRKTGEVKVVVLGQFKNRRVAKAFTVTR